jgi:hypothetical protein
MNIHIFNATLFIGWLLAFAGGLVLNVGAGLLAGGLLLIVLALLVSRIAGGIFIPQKDAD